MNELIALLIPAMLFMWFGIGAFVVKKKVKMPFYSTALRRRSVRRFRYMYRGVR